MIYIPKEFMVGFQRRVNYKGMPIDTDRDNEYVLGFATYKDEKGKTRCETSWSNWKHDENPVLTFPNQTLAGFKIAGTETRGGGWNSSGRSVFDVQDPRGFILQINSGNLIEIINQCEIKNGVIQNPCLWSWEGQSLILVPEGTDLYKEGFESFRLKSKKISAKNINPGDMVTLQNGTQGMWLGGQYVTNETEYNYYVPYDKRHTKDYDYPGKHEIIINKPKRKMFFLKDNNNLQEKISFKVAEITQSAKKPFTAEEVATLLNKHLEFYRNREKMNDERDYKDRDRSLLDGWNYDWNFRNHILISPKKPKDVELLKMFASEDKTVSMWDKDIANKKDKEFQNDSKRSFRWRN